MGAATDRLTLHATCVAVDGRGVLITGPSGAGKSDLALRLIDAGAALVGDDLVTVARVGDGLEASGMPALFGLIEVRGLGIMPVADTLAAVPLALAVTLARSDPARDERVPEPASLTLHGIDLPVFTIDPAMASAAARVRLLAAGARPRERLFGAGAG